MLIFKKLEDDFYEFRNSKITKQFLSELISSGEIVEYLIKDSSFAIVPNSNSEIFSNSNTIKTNLCPLQIIYFGAPGTGKSYKLKEESEKYFDKNNCERVTFHPNYSYGNFVGTYKPFPISLLKNQESKEVLTDNYGNKEEKITYKFVAGPLIKILLKALENPNEDFLLIIEEINRANTAAVFGDFFQLLDRNSIGESEYPIGTSEELKSFFENNFEEENKNKIKEKIGQNYENLILPNNLYIWATMNSADQGVMPLDTAFKRRWDFEYIGIDEATQKANWTEHSLNILKDGKNIKISWNNFRKAINNTLSFTNIPEDKLLGPYFIAKSILDKGEEKIKKAIKNKVLMYLYEDVLRSNRTKLFKPDYSKTYSSLCEGFDKIGLDIFDEKIEWEKWIEQVPYSIDIKKINISDGKVADSQEPSLNTDSNIIED